MHIGSVFSSAAAVLGLVALAGAGEPVVRMGSAGFPYQPAAGPSFVNWENHPIHPLEITPDGDRLLVTNLPDDRLEVFDISNGSPVLLGSIPVGVDPVSVRAASDTRAWVVNHISDSVSIVDLGTMSTVRTLDTADEPFDLVFAGGRAFVSCSQANLVQVFNLADLDALPIGVEIDGEDPRALAVSPDGMTVYCAIFESGNATTILGGGIDQDIVIGFPPNAVSDAAGPYGGLNPPPNAGNAFEPPIAGGNNPPVKVGLIVRKNAQGKWMDDNNHDWTPLVSGNLAAKSGRPIGWDMPDHDVAMIRADGLSVTYASGLMNINMALAVNPASGIVTVVGTEATNEVRFEPNVAGRFVRVHGAIFDPGMLNDFAIVDLNSHLTYDTASIPQPERDKSIGDPRGIVWNAAGTKAYIAGMGSNNLIVVNTIGQRIGKAPTIEVGEGPIGLALDEARARLYVLNRFEGSISVVNTTTELEIDRVSYFDPTPMSIRAGRKHLYDTRLTSGLGQTSCAACHVDARMDRLAWDLGDPSGVKRSAATANKGAGITGLKVGQTFPPFEATFHPMKGPMTTQTLQDIISHEPLHWRGDRDGIEEFNGAFVGLLGDDVQLTPSEMQEFEDMLDSITFPPNPFRTIDNALPADLPLPGHFTTGTHGPAGNPLPNGNALKGLGLYTSLQRPLDNPFACVTCHTLPTGAGTGMTFSGGKFIPIAPGPKGEAHHMLVSVDGSTNRNIKVPQLRNGYEKTGFNMIKTSSRHGFGVLHDGSIDTLERFVDEPAFSLASDQETADLVAFLLAFSGSDLPDGDEFLMFNPPGTPSQDTHAAVGTQATVLDGGDIPPEQAALLAKMEGLASAGRVGLIVKGRLGGMQRGWVYEGGGVMQSDRQDEATDAAGLLALAGPGSELTYTVVPLGTQVRRGIDRDEDGWLDRDEIDRCSDPADASSYPGGRGHPDCDGSGNLDLFDFLCFVNRFNEQDPAADCDGNGAFDLFDFLCFVNAFNTGCA